MPNVIATPSMPNVIATPSMPRSSNQNSSSGALPKVNSNRTVVTPNIGGRDASGRFTKNPGTGDQSKNQKETPEEKKQSSILSNFAGRIANVAAATTVGAEEVDPTIKAFKEVSEPMMRGYQMLSGGGDKKTGWFRKIFRELNLFRKDESVFNKAEAKVLKNIEGKSGGGGEESPGFLGGLLGSISPWVMAAITGIGGALLTGVTAVLGVIFSPIGLAIGAVATVAWGLFTENGQKFFGEVGAKIIAGWDTVVTAFAPITESISKGWDTVKGGFDSLISGMVSSWDAFTGFLKDKFGIDLPAILKPVVDAGKKAVEVATEAVKPAVDAAKETAAAGTEAAKNTAQAALDAVKKSSPKTTEALGNALDKVSEGVGKIKSHATGKTAANKAAMIAEMDAQGITDPKERAMMMAQADHESGGFAFTKELGKDSYFDKYDAGTKKGRDLGNTEKGDGLKYKGRGLIQLTGRSNYEAAGKDLGLDLVNHPELAETPENAAKTAMWFWKKNKKLSEKAKQGDVLGTRKIVNGGTNGLDDVNTKYNKYLAEGVPSQTPESTPAVASISDDPTQGGRYKYETLEGGKVQVTDNQTGIMELASDEQVNAYRKQQGKPYLDKLAAVNAGDIPLYNSLAAGPVNTQVQTTSPTSPRVPTFAPPPPIAEAPPIIQPLGSDSNRNMTVTMAPQDVGQDVRDRGIAHIATGGLSGRG
jgi:predicted chitinase